METVYYIKNKKSYCFLNKKGGWNRSRGTYNLAEFKTKEEAESAIPADVDCIIEKVAKKDKPVLENVDYVLYFKGKLFNKSESFVLSDVKDKEVFRFSSEDEAVAKADSLDLNMDFVEVDTVKKS